MRRFSSEPAKKSGQDIPKNRCRTTIAEADSGNASGTALYRGSGHLLRAQPGRPKGGRRPSGGAGIHTFPLVAMASCGPVKTAICVIGASISNNANILQGVVTGIGFIGLGAIIR